MTTLRTAVTGLLMMLSTTTLAMAQATGGGPTGPAGPAKPSGAASFFPIAMLGAVVVFMLLTSRSQKKREARKRTELYDRMSKNDRVRPIHDSRQLKQMSFPCIRPFCDVVPATVLRM